MIDLFFCYMHYLRQNFCLKENYQNQAFLILNIFFNNAMSESRVAKLHAIIKWMIIQFSSKEIITDLYAINEKEKQMPRKKCKTCLYIFKERKKRKIMLNTYFFMLSF